jgi:glycosyltransferase involved in cell wall biosynthesis
MGNNDLRPDVASSPPLVTIITPFYNTDPYLEECITSVLQQTYTNWKYILVDSCSTDRSVGSWIVTQNNTRVKFPFTTTASSYHRSRPIHWND